MAKETTNQNTPAQTKIVLDNQKQGWWSSLTDGQRQMIVTLAIVLGISVTALIAIKFASNQVRKVVSNKEENQSFGEDKHATWAKQLKMAFDNDGWWGTDEASVRRVIRELPSKEDFKKVQVSYRRLYEGQNLIKDLTDELKATEFNEMLAILQSKPDRDNGDASPIYDPYAWAKRLYNAMSIYYAGFIPGTDEEAIQAVFSELPSQAAFIDTAQAYQILYGTSLETDLDGDLDWSMDWRAIISKKSKN